MIANGKHLKKLLRTDTPAIFEIGCNDGLDTAKMLKVFPKARIQCFEPDPRAVKEFLSSSVAGKCELHQVAIGRDVIAKKAFYQSSGHTRGAYKKDWNLSGSLNTPTGHMRYSPWVKFKRVIEVVVKPLDSFVEDNQIIDLLWMDVQGGEQNVMRGGRKALAQTRYIYTEFGHWHEPLYEGQMTLDETIAELGSDWQPLGIYENSNILARNTQL